MLDRFFLCGFWSIFYVYIGELYPTEIRSIGFGWTSVVGMLGSTIAPYVAQIATLIHLNTWFLTAAIGIGTWFCTFCLR